MKTKIFGIPIDLADFCLINGAIQLCESLYYVVVNIIDFSKKSEVSFHNIYPIVLFVLLALSGASLVYGGKKVSWIVETADE